MNINNKSETIEHCPRIGIFIDVQNMYYCAKSLNKKVDYSKLLEVISDGRNIIVANVYMMIKPGVEMRNFENMLTKNGYDIKKKNMVFRKKEGYSTPSNSSSWDIGMTLDMIKWAGKLDTIVLVSGNGNFVESIQYLKNFCRVEIAGIRDQTSIVLRNNSDFFIEIATEGTNNCMIDGKFDEEDKSEDVSPTVKALESEAKVDVDPDSQVSFLDKIDASLRLRKR